MRVLFIANATTTRGGANIVLLNLVSELASNGVVPCVVCPDKNGIYEVFKNLGIEVTAIPMVADAVPNLNSFKDVCLFIPRLIKWRIINHMAFKQLLKICKKFRPDIIHSNSSVIGVGFYVSEVLDIPHITHFREYGDLDFQIKIRGLKRRLIKSKNYSISITNGVAEHHHVKEHPHNKIIYDGVIDEHHVVDRMPYKGDYFFYAGRITHYKGIDSLISAYIKYASVSSRPLRLIVAGDIGGSYKSLYKKLNRQIEAAGLHKLVEWVGEIDNCRVNEYMRSAYATVIPSHFEGFGLVMPEAISQGCITIGRNTAGTKEQFDNGLKYTKNEIGFRFSSDDELAEVLNMISDMDANQITEFLHRAQSTVKEFYTIQASAYRILTFYKEILR